MEWLEKQKATRRLRGDTTVLREEASGAVFPCIVFIYESIRFAGAWVQHIDPALL